MFALGDGSQVCTFTYAMRLIQSTYVMTFLPETTGFEMGRAGPAQLSFGGGQVSLPPVMKAWWPGQSFGDRGRYLRV
jgi:hypothetical protein